MRYAPFASVLTDRTFSMSTSRAASTVTPGSTAPVVSFTTPANALCARAAVGNASTATSTSSDNSRFFIPTLLNTSAELHSETETIAGKDQKLVESSAAVGACGGLLRKLG